MPLLLAGLAATLVLKLTTMGAARLDCWLLMPMVGALAWPLWAWRREQLLFVRRLLLAGATLESARLRRWLWRGTVAQTLAVVSACLWAVALLLAAARLTPLQWGLLAADAALLAALSPPLQRWLGREIRPPFVGTVARRWPVLVANAVLLVAAFVAQDYWLGFADTRALSWSELVAHSLRVGQDGAACPSAAALLGVAALADELPRHAALLFLPEVADRGARLLGWLVLLGVTGLGAYLFTRYLLGALALLECWRAPASGSEALEHGERLFVDTTVALLAAAALAAALGLRLDTVALDRGALRLALLANPCARIPGRAPALQGDAQRQLDAAARQAVDAAMQPVNAGLTLAFAAAEKGIDAYLDWYFSFVGSYTRLGAMVIPDLDQHMRQQFSTRVFGDSGFDPQVARLGAAADTVLLGRIAAEAETIAAGLAQQLKLEPCLREVIHADALPGLARDKTRIALSAAVALPLSRAVLPLALRAGEAVLARAAARQTVRAAASAAGSTSGKRGASVLLSAGAASALCAPGGPLALACGVVAGAVTWLGVDMALIAVDEALFREKLKAELVSELQAQRSSLREALRAQLEQAASAYSDQAQRRLDKVFVPAANG